MREDDQKTRYSILRMKQTIVYLGFNAGKYIILILRAESPIFGHLSRSHKKTDKNKMEGKTWEEEM